MWLAVIDQSGPSLWSASVTLAEMLSGIRFADPSCADSAIEKHPACAAAINSSGFVPCPFSNRVENEYCVSFSTPLGAEIVPFPSFSPPFQTALALRCMIFLLDYDFKSRSIVDGTPQPCQERRSPQPVS